jgi:hypothetical protein
LVETPNKTAMKRIEEAIFCIAILFFSCNPAPSLPLQEDPKTVLISFDVDAQKQIPITTSDRSFLHILAPQPNIVWHFNEKNGVEWLDLQQAGPSPQLDFPENFLDQVYEQKEVQVDPTDPGILWIYKYHTGILKYNAYLNLFQYYLHPNCYGMHILEDEVVVPLMEEGFIVLDKELNVQATLPPLPEGELLDLSKSDRWGLLFNGYRYDPDKKEMLPLTQIGDIRLAEGCNWLLEKDEYTVFAPGKAANIVRIITGDTAMSPPFYVYRHRFIRDSVFWSYHADKITSIELPRLRQQSFQVKLPRNFSWRQVRDEERLWIFARDLLFSFDWSEQQLYLHDGFTGVDRPLQVFSDDVYLYYLQDGQLSVYNKSWLKEQEQLFDYQWYTKETERYQRAMDSMQMDQATSFAPYKQQVSYLEAFFDAWLQITQPVPHLELSRVFYAQPSFLEEVAKEFLAGKLEEKYLNNLEALIRLSAKQGNIQQSLEAAAFAGKNHPDLVQTFSPDYLPGLDSLQNIRQRLERLEPLELPEDERLFQKAKIYQDLCSSTWFYSEQVCDQSLAIQLYQQLIKQYPDSQRRDDAEFILLNFQLRDPETGYIEGSPKAFIDFLETYPNSDRKGQCLLTLLEIYSTSYRDQPGAKQKGRNIANQIAREHPDLLDDPVYSAYANEFQ